MRILSAICFSFIFSPLFLLSQSLSRTHQFFDDGWKFHLGNASDPTKDFNYGIANLFSKTGKAEGTAIDRKFVDTGWRTVRLPHDWAVELPFEFSENSDVMAHGYKPVGGLYPQNSIGWYRKRFTINKEDSGKLFQLQFDGIFRDSKVWVNGFYLGSNESGYLGVNYDITNYVDYGKENVVVVRVDATQYEGWFYEGAGIYRHAWLNEYNDVHLENERLQITSVVTGTRAAVSVAVPVYNESSRDTRITVTSYVTSREGKQVGHSATSTISLKTGDQRVLRQQLQTNNPHLWSIEDPYLYRVITFVKSGSRVIDSVSTRYGVRIISITPDGLFLNGKYVKVKGVNCHQDHAGVGSALPDYLQYYRVNLLKELGANAYRTSHNAPTPELLDACDSLGMLVLDEQRLLNSSPEYMNQFERLIRRDRNHPSIFLWSIGNEEGYVQTTPIGKKIAMSLIQKQKELDPTRTCTYAADVANVFHGINEVIPVRGFNYRVAGVDPYHKDHPNQPILGTEMGSTVTTRGIYIKDTVNGYVPDQDITAPWWANTAEQWWAPAAERKWWMGGFVWTGLDYRGEPTPFAWPNINSHFGIMDVCGFPKNIYYYYQSWWTDKDVLHISPHWNWKGKEGKPIDVWVNTNADDVELFLNGRSLGKKNMPKNSHLEWAVNYEEGTLEAVAYKKGKRLTQKISTTGAAAEIVVTPYKTTMLADGRDAAVINITAIDKEGREVPDANNLITFSLTGDAAIIGVGNGDPSSHEPDKIFGGKWQRRLFNGKCQVILQSGHSPSQVRFEANSVGLWTGATDIYTITPGHSSIQKPFAGSIKKVNERMLGADISFLPELELKGVRFSDKGVQKDAIQILKDHGLNYVRLRIFHSPANDSGYSPGKGFCDLEHTKAMAKRIKAADMKFLLDFHYSDYWADPGKQFKPLAWQHLNFQQLQDSVYQYTKAVMQALQKQGTVPDMVQVGNEINHGMLWPEGHIAHLDSLAELIKAGTNAIKETAPSAVLLIHIALGGQHDESVFFLDNMLQRGVQFDLIGLSYYPKWHGTLDDLNNNLAQLARRYNRGVVVVEYSQLKKEVNDIVFNLPANEGKGTFIWEPLNTWESVFDKEGKSNEQLEIYDSISKQYIGKKR